MVPPIAKHAWSHGGKSALSVTACCWAKWIASIFTFIIETWVARRRCHLDTTPRVLLNAVVLVLSFTQIMNTRVWHVSPCRNVNQRNELFDGSVCRSAFHGIWKIWGYCWNIVTMPKQQHCCNGGAGRLFPHCNFNIPVCTVVCSNGATSINKLSKLCCSSSVATQQGSKTSHFAATHLCCNFVRIAATLFFQRFALSVVEGPRWSPQCLVGAKGC